MDTYPGWFVCNSVQYPSLHAPTLLPMVNGFRRRPTLHDTVLLARKSLSVVSKDNVHAGCFHAPGNLMKPTVMLSVFVSRVGHRGMKACGENEWRCVNGSNAWKTTFSWHSCELSYTPWFSDWSNRNRRLRYNSTRPDAASGWHMDRPIYSSDFDVLMTYLTLRGAKSRISM